VQLPFHAHCGATVHAPFVHVPVQQSLAPVHAVPFSPHVFPAHTPPVHTPEQHASSPIPPPHGLPSALQAGLRT
jgi:hypothetical protein